MYVCMYVCIYIYIYSNSEFVKGHALVFDDKGRFYECDLKSGHLSPHRHRDLATTFGAFTR